MQVMMAITHNVGSKLTWLFPSRLTERQVYLMGTGLSKTCDLVERELVHLVNFEICVSLGHPNISVPCCL